MTTMTEIQHADYSLVGKDAALAVEKGLANAQWFTPHVPKETMRALLERRDGPAIRDTVLWLVLLTGFGAAGYLLWGTGWAIIPFAVYGVLYASVSDSRWHETSHGTAFKTDWLNNVIYEIASFMVLREATPWRWSHTRHHSDTIIVGRDAEIAFPRPIKVASTLLKFVNGEYWIRYWQRALVHCTGRLTAEELTYIPEAEHSRVILRARIYAVMYAAVIGLALYTGSILPLLYVGLPNLYGAWLMVIYGATQHAGLAENVLDHRLNTRTVYMNAINRYLYWNMGYHIEHHIFPLVPYHALPKLHEVIKAEMPRPYYGLVAAYREIIPTLWRQSRDATYYVKRELPTPAWGLEDARAAEIVTAQVATVTDGWVEVCGAGQLGHEDVLRFDHDNRTYAIYRAEDNTVYATDGLCTHAQAHLADGLLKGTLIECPKHNGRFDIRDGSPQRRPVRVPLQTYEVQEADGMIRLNLKPAGGVEMVETVATYTFTVVSNDNIATFIKELVLDLADGSPPLLYQPGDYMQFDIPAYPERSLRDVDVRAPYIDVWNAHHTFDLRASNPIACRRSYSFATNPATDRQLRFNVRLATPPADKVGRTGVGSAYVFGLKPGDRITAVGPYGAFHIQPTEREMVYLGGGSGMAPLRSHLAYLFETQKTARRVSYWYGARSRMEMFYQDYFEGLVRDNSNFTFHVALSEPLPEDEWSGHTGFIHAVLQREYLEAHANPTQLEYYLCGPPPMVRAAIKMLTDMGVDRDQIANDEF